MKKSFKVSSIVLAFMLIVSSFASISAFAGNDDPRLTVGGDDSYDINIGISGATEIGISGTKYVKSSSVADASGQMNSVNTGNILVYKFDMPKLSVGKQIDKFVFRFAHADSSNTKTWFFKKVQGTDISAITPAIITSSANANDSELVVNFQQTFSSSTSYYVKIITADISSYVQECYRAGQDHFYIALYNSSTYKVWRSANTTVNANGSGFNGADVVPYGYYTESDAGELSYLSATAPVSAEDGVSFVFSNPIDASSVSASEFKVEDLTGNVAVSDEDISVSGSTVTLTKDWEECGHYSVSFNGSVSDVYGQQIEVSASVSFEIPSDSTTASATVLPVFGIKADGSFQSENYGKITANKTYVLYKFDLSAIDNTKAIIGADFKWTSQASGNAKIQVLQVPNGTWTDETTLANDIANNDYYNAISAATNNVVYETTEDFGSEYSVKTLVGDVSGEVSKALANDESYITFAFTANGTHNYYTNSSSLNYAQRPYLTLTLVDPSFGAVKSVPEKGGVMNGVNAPVELLLSTSVADEYATADYIKLIKVSDNKEAEISVVADGSKLTLTPAADLAERSEYKVVLKSGITDTFGNVLEADKVISRFVSGTALEFYEIKFTYDESPVYDEMETIESYNAGDSVTAVAKFKNNSGTDLDAVMLIALYAEDGDLLAVDATGGTACAPANQETQYAKTITVPSNAESTYVKAFIWSDLDDIRPICKDESINQAK